MNKTKKNTPPSVIAEIADIARAGGFRDAIGCILSTPEEAA